MMLQNVFHNFVMSIPCSKKQSSITICLLLTGIKSMTICMLLTEIISITICMLLTRIMSMAICMLWARMLATWKGQTMNWDLSFSQDRPLPERKGMCHFIFLAFFLAYFRKHGHFCQSKISFQPLRLSVHPSVVRRSVMVPSFRLPNKFWRKASLQVFSLFEAAKEYKLVYLITLSSLTASEGLDSPFSHK